MRLQKNLNFGGITMNKREPKISVVIISLGIAIILWFYVLAGENPNITQRFNNIPVTIKNSIVLEEKGLILSEKEEYTVDIRVYGRTSQLYGLRKEIEASIDLSPINGKGEYDIEVSIEGLPESVDLQNVCPESIKVAVDRLVEKEQEININIEGEPQNGLKVMGYMITPDKVSLSGPEEILTKVQRVEGTVNVHGANGDIQQKVEIHALDDKGKILEGVTLSRSDCDVHVQIGKTKNIEIVANIEGQAAEGYIITGIHVEPKEITLGSKDNRIENINEILTEKINIQGITSNLERSVNLQLPVGIDLIDQKDKAVKVSIIVESIKREMYDIDTIKWINQPENLELELLEETNFRLELEGKSTDIDKINKANIVLYADVNNIVEGRNTIEVKMEPIEGIQLINITPKTIEITATNKASPPDEGE